MNDDELRNVLRGWELPGAPRGVERRIFAAPWWRRSVAVPVPALAAALLLLLVWGLAVLRPAGSTREVRLSDFEPAAELKVRVIRSSHADK